MTSPTLQREKNTFSKCRDSTLRPVCYNDNEKGRAPQNKLSSSLRRTDGDAGLELHTVGLELLLIGNKLRWGETGDKQPRFSPSLGSQESAHHLTPPSP